MSREWDGTLRKGEEVLWQGAPGTGFLLTMSERREFFSGLAGFAIAALCIGIASHSSSAIGAWLIGGTVFVYGLWPMSEALLREPSHRSRTIYLLTNQAAYIILREPGGRSQRFDIVPEMPLDLISFKDAGTVIFHEKEIEVGEGTDIRKTGFEHIPDAEHVFALMSDLRGTPSDDVVWNRPVIRA